MNKSRRRKTREGRCGYCRMAYGDLKRCRLCRAKLCPYHLDTEDHHCQARSGMGLGDKPIGSMTIIDLLKAGAIMLVIVVIIRMGLDLLSKVFGLVKRGWRVAKAQALVWAAVPAALALSTMMFPTNAMLMDEGVDIISDMLPDYRLGYDILPSRPAIFLKPPEGLTEKENLRGCVKTMDYASTLENPEGQKCRDLCEARGYTSYGIVRDGNSYDCFCCYGSGTALD